jgi:hypothetical protein
MCHQDNHLERDYPQWLNTMNLMAKRFLDECSLTKQSSSLEINAIDQESQERTEDTTMPLWDSNHLMPFNDTVEVKEPHAEVLVVNTRGRSQPVQINPTTTQLSRGKPMIDHPKPLLSPQRNPISIHT